MPRFPRPTLVAAAIAAIPLTFAIARAGVDPPPSPSAAREAPKDAVPAAFARVDLRSIMDHAPFREAQLERMREILDRYRPAIDSCRQEMDAIVDEWEKLPEHDEIPPQLEDRTEEVLKRWEKARRGLLRDASEFADGEGRPLCERLRILLDDAARRGGFTAVFQMPREGGGATWGTEGRDDADFGQTQAVVWCRDCTDLTDEISEVIGIPEDAWVEGSGFRRVAIEFRGEFESYAEPPPWNWEVAEEDAGEEAPE